jgi:hypothetical protein
MESDLIAEIIGRDLDHGRGKKTNDSAGHKLSAPTFSFENYKKI